MTLHFSVPLVHVDTLDEDDEDLVTIVEKEKIDIEKKVVMVTDRFRTVEKLLYCDNLQDFLVQGNLKFSFPDIGLILDRENLQLEKMISKGKFISNSHSIKILRIVLTCSSVLRKLSHSENHNVILFTTLI